MIERLIALIETAYRRFDAWLAVRYNGYGDIYGDVHEAVDEERERAARDGRERRF